MKPHVDPVTRTWFLRRAADRFYMLREATSLFVGLYALHLTLGLVARALGPSALTAWSTLNDHLLLRAFSLAALAMASLHTATWFALAPKALPTHLGERRVSPRPIVAALWAVFAVTCVAVIGWVPR